MNISEAIAKRIKNICKERNISSNNPKLLTIFRICYGLNITISEFFNDKIFENLDLDI